MNINTRKLVMGGILLALGVLLPSAFHYTGLDGTIFSPMHIPVLLGGFILGPVMGLIVGALTPILNMLISSMPQPPFLWIMIVELGVYGLAGGLFFKLFRQVKGGMIISLIFAMILGRLAGGLTVYILSNLLTTFKLQPIMFLNAAFISALPGIITHLVLVPVLFKAYKMSSNNNIQYRG